MFRDRSEAGRKLAARLIQYAATPAVIFGVPRGGIIPAYDVAIALNLPLKPVVVKKIGHPGNREFAIGAASLTGHYVTPYSQASDTYMQTELQAVRSRLQEMARLYNYEDVSTLEGMTAIIIDDGIATGNTMLATVRLLKQKDPAKL